MNYYVSEWVIVVLRQFINFSAISWRAQDNFQRDDDEIHFVLDQHAEFDFCYSSSSLKQQSASGNVAPLGHIFLIPSKPVCFFSLMLRASRRTHDLPHSRRARQPLRHRCGFTYYVHNLQQFTELFRSNITSLKTSRIAF